MPDIGNNKNIWLVIVLTLMTSLTSLGTALINSSSNIDKKELLLFKKDLKNIVNTVNLLNERSSLSYLGMSEESLDRSAKSYALVLTSVTFSRLCKEKSFLESVSQPTKEITEIYGDIEDTTCKDFQLETISGKFRKRLVYIKPLTLQTKIED